jgi:hypothetical protein
MKTLPHSRAIALFTLLLTLALHPGFLAAQTTAKPAAAKPAPAKSDPAATQPATKPAKPAKAPQPKPAPAAEPAKPVELSTESPTDMVKGDVNLTIKLVLPPGEKMGRDVYFKVAGYTVLNSRPKLYEWSQFGKAEATIKLERVNILVFTAGRNAKTEGKGPKKAELLAKEYIWRAKLPADAKPGQTDIEPTKLEVTLELKPADALPNGALEGTDVSWDLKLTDNQFNVGALWLDKTGKPQTDIFPNLKDLQSSLSERGIDSAMILRANETDTDTDPIIQIKVINAGGHRTKGLSYLALWMTQPGDGLLLLERTSHPTDDLIRMTQAPDPSLFRKHVVFKQNDLGDFSSADKANRKGPIFYGKLSGKYLKFQIDEIAVNNDPTKTPFKLTGRVVVQPDGSNNLAGQ